MFSPSQLALGEECLLRTVLGSTAGTRSLRAHPLAALGRVFHELVEMALRGRLPRDRRVEQNVGRALDALLDREDRRLAEEWGGDNPPRLRKLLPPMVWRRKRRAVLNLAEKYAARAIRHRGSSATTIRELKDVPAAGAWPEVRLEASALRLHGRADLIERSGGGVVVRDLKTGRVQTKAGDILPHIMRQMRLYGAMVREILPAAPVSLIVDHGVETAVSFTEADQSEVRAWLAAVLQRLPADCEVDAQALASPGQACEACAYRHVCPTYREAAPGWWREESAVRMPLDTWGDVVAVAAEPDGLTTLTLRDAAGRLVKVFGLSSFRLIDVNEGDPIWLFGLRTRDRRGGPALWRQPRNFCEVADDDPFVRAWTVQVFTGL